MGVEFMSDAKTMEQAGSAREGRTPRGFVLSLSWIARPRSPALLWPRWEDGSPFTDSVSCNLGQARETALY